MKRLTLTDAISWFFVLFLFYSGMMKFMDIAHFRQELSAWPLIEPAAGFLAWALPAAGIILAGLLALPKTRLKALYGTVGYWALFVVYDLMVLMLDYHIVSTSGGMLDELSPREYTLFNGACLLLSLLAILAVARQKTVRGYAWLPRTFAVAATAMIVWTLFSSFTAPVKHRSGFEGRPLPAIGLLRADSVSWFNTKDLPDGQPIIVIGFAPFCKYCQKQTRDILEHAYLFRNTRILYITPEEFRSMKIFYRHYGLQKYPNIFMGRDSANIYFRYFKAPGTPYIAVYDGKKRLKTVIDGQVDAQRLIESVEN